MAVVSLSIVPLGTKTTSLSDYVVAVHQAMESDQAVVDGKINIELNAMDTVLDGDLDEVWAFIRRIHEVPFENGQNRVMTTIKVDDRRDKQTTSAAKINTVRAKMGK